LFLLRYLLVLLQIVVTITILNVLQDYSTLALTPYKRQWGRTLKPKKHLSVLFIYVRYAEKVKIEMFMICNLRCADAAPRLTTGNACPSRFFLVFISSCIHFKSFMCPMLNTLLFLYFSSLCIMHAMSHYLELIQFLQGNFLHIWLLYGHWAEGLGWSSGQKNFDVLLVSC
jgi:hypothetical protein